MEAGRSRRCQTMGQNNRPDAEGRVAQLRALWQEAQGQLSRARHEKLQTRRGLALTTRNDRFCANCSTLNDVGRKDIH
eukprot:6340379-Heterocapsa_arctica.AAC.1